MKTPAFWYRPSGLHAALLSPLSAFYRWGKALRKVGARPYKAKIPVICIGNIVAGGAGKTPTALTLARLLKQQGAAPVFVTRGYGGTERGPLRVEPLRHTAREVGDEALLLAAAAPCWIGRDRAAAIRAAEPHGTHIILDDGLQNPHLAPTLSLLVIDAAAGLGNGRLIPAGPLREPLQEALRKVKAVVLIGNSKPAEEELLRTLVTPVPIFRASLKPALPPDFPRDRAFFAFAGIGRPEKFYATCRAVGLKLVGTRDFPDHHPFTAQEGAELAAQARVHDAQLLTTTKDWVRLPDDLKPEVAVLPVELAFADEAAVLSLLAQA